MSSGDGATATLGRAGAWLRPDLPRTRVLALVGLAALLASFLSVLHYIVSVSGDPGAFYLLVALALAAATALARVLRVRIALSLAGAALAVGLLWYLGALSDSPAVGALVASNVELLSGQSILEIEASTVWALSVTPTPVFVTWYLGLRGWYGSATVVASGMLGYFVLTGDATLALTLLGVVGGAATLAFGDLDRRETSSGALEYVAVVLAVMVVAPLVVSVLPGSAGLPLALGGTGSAGGEGTLEASLLSADSDLQVQGAIDLSPKVRFTVTSPVSEYWRVDSYNRYTGSGWIRSGEPIPYGEASLPAPPGEARRVEQTFRVESTSAVMPAAWRPVAVEGPLAASTRVTTEYGLLPDGRLRDGTRYEVVSAVTRASPRELAAAGGSDPADIERRYLQLPSGTPDRVAERTDAIVGGTDNRYATAMRIERWLEANREYSLDVDRPDGNIADAFLFEMERGYCTYYATAMTVMLRTQGIPARMTVGYTPGQQVDGNEYVVRGYNAHAWVEVYFPDEGWVRFDPTPAGPRRQAAQERLEEARANDVPNVDTDESADTPTPDSTATSTPDDGTPGGVTTTPVGPTPDPFDFSTPTAFEDDTEGTGFALPELPPPNQLVLFAIVVVGLTAGIRRSGLARRTYRWAWLRYLPREDPATDVEQAFQRLSYLLERRHRPRRPGETVREYLDAVDASAPARELAALRERVRYADEATEGMAEEAADLLDRVRRQ